MVRLSNSEIRALFVQYQQHRNCECVHIHRGLLGRLQFSFEEPKNEEALKEVKIAEEKLRAAKRKANLRK